MNALIFDLDGTLADTMPVHYEAWMRTVQPHGLELSEDRFYALGGWPTKRIIQLLADERGITVDVDALAREKERQFLEHLDLVQPIEPVVSVARRERGSRPLGVATSAVRRVGERILQRIGLAEWFDATVFAEDVARHKPEPDIFLEAARRLSVEPSGCVVYEDTDPGIEAARRAGMTVIDVRTLYTPRRVTQRG